MTNKKTGLLIIIFVSFLVLSTSIVYSGKLRFGIIKAIDNKIDELKEEQKEEKNETDENEQNPFCNLPDILTFETQKSDQFIVNINHICDGHPFKGKNANQPHCGAHVNFDNSLNTWPQGGTKPENYPPIYAATNGIVTRVDYSFSLGTHDRYGVDVAFARGSNDLPFLLCYSIEPMVPEPATDFYKAFILVVEGQEVKKGEIIAYMYMPPGGDIGIHIHFHILQMNQNDFMAPAIFTSTLVDQFYAKWNIFKNDGPDPMPSCMGYKLTAEENPFGTGAIDVLK